MSEAARIVIDPDELERVASDVARSVPAHLFGTELRKRIAENAMRRQPSEAVRERARRIAEEARKR